MMKFLKIQINKFRNLNFVSKTVFFTMEWLLDQNGYVLKSGPNLRLTCYPNNDSILGVLTATIVEIPNLVNSNLKPINGTLSLCCNK